MQLGKHVQIFIELLLYISSSLSNVVKTIWCLLLKLWFVYFFHEICLALSTYIWYVKIMKSKSWWFFTLVNSTTVISKSLCALLLLSDSVSNYCMYLSDFYLRAFRMLHVQILILLPECQELHSSIMFYFRTRSINDDSMQKSH